MAPEPRCWERPIGVDPVTTPAKQRTREPMSARWKRMPVEEKQRRIIDAVLSLIAKYGVPGTTTARIAAAVRTLVEGIAPP